MGADVPATLFDTSFVDTSVEAGCKRLEEQIELSGGFWLGFVFSSAPPEISLLRIHAAGLISDHNKIFYQRKLDHPDDFADLVAWLLSAPEVLRADLIWIESVHSDSTGTNETPFADGWKEFLVLANQKRDAIRKSLRGGLAFIAPPEIKDLIRVVAPDFWSVRSLVIEVTSDAPLNIETTNPGVSMPTIAPTAMYLESEDDGRICMTPLSVISIGDWAESVASEIPAVVRKASTTDANTAPWSERAPVAGTIVVADEGASTRHAESGEFPAISSHHARIFPTSNEYELIDALISAGKLAEAENESQRLRRALGDDQVLDLAFTHHLSSKIREAEGKNWLAFYEMTDALDAYRRAAPEFVPIEWYVRAAQLAARCSDERALELLTIAVAECRRRVRLRETTEVLLQLVVALQLLGDWKNQHREIEAAHLLYDEAVTVSRRLVDLRGDDRDAINSLLMSMIRYGDICRNRNSFSQADATFGASVRLGEKLCNIESESRWSLSQYAIALNRLAGLKQSIDDWEGARQVYRKSLDIRRRVVAMRNDRESIQRLISVLKKLAQAETYLGNDSVAASLAQECRLLEDRLRQ